MSDPLLSPEAQAMARVEPSARAFANAITDEGKSVGVVRFANGICIFCMDHVDGSKELREAFGQLMAKQGGLTSVGDLKL